jgi:hypothetical protein
VPDVRGNPREGVSWARFRMQKPLTAVQISQ